jgi:hypothetical protein
MPDESRSSTKAPDLGETAAAIARGLVRQAQRSAERADQQVEGAQAAMEQSGRVLNRAHRLLDDMPREQNTATTGSLIQG